MIEEGQAAPDFELPDQDGNPVRLSDLRGGKVVLYFYPKANTPGCTTQACGVRDHEPDYAEVGAVVLGVSPDPVEAVKRFHDEQALNFTLLADADHAVCEAYGVWGEKSMYGKKYWGAQRSTFVIDEAGVVGKIIEKVKPETHDDVVLVVSSGGAIGRALADIAGAPARTAIELNLQCRNSGFCELIAGSGGTLRLLSFNNVPHLESPARRQAITFA
jgi:peroxiredoxin Q/BCP